MLVLPVASSRIRPASSSAVWPAADQPDIVGQLVLGKLAAELVDDPRKLVDRAIAHARPAPSRLNGRCGR